MSQLLFTDDVSTERKKFQLFIAIDFGTDGVGLAYANKKDIYIHEKWESSRYGTTVKPKTIILLDEDGNTEAFGIEAKMSYMTITSSTRNKWMLFDRFKMSLFDKCQHTKNGNKIDTEDILTAVNGKQYPSEKVFIAAFKHLHNQANLWLKKKRIKLKPEEIQWIITVPAIWNDKAKNKMKNWAIKAGLIDKNIKDQIKIVYEPDCASLTIQHEIMKTKTENKTDDNDMKHNFKPGDKYILVDAGGGTVDIVCHQIVGKFGAKELIPPSGGPWGSCYIDDEYIKLLETLFTKQWMDEFRQEEPNTYVEIIHNFQQSKLTFYSNSKNETHNVELPCDFCGFLEEKFDDMLENEDDESDIEEQINDYIEEKTYKIFGKSELISLDEQMLEINMFIWESMLFGRVINPIIKHVEQLLNNPNLMRGCKFLSLVGGLSCSPYFKYKMQYEFGLKSKYGLNIIVPNKPILSVVLGAAYFGLTDNFIKTRRLKYTYGICLRWYKSVAVKYGISEKYIKNNLDNMGCVEGCFEIIAQKNEEIYINQVKTITTIKSGTSFIQILCSNKENPKVKDDGEVIATLTINRDEKDGYETITEFHFYDTLLKVYAYSKGNSKSKQKVDVKYGAK